MVVGIGNPVSQFGAGGGAGSAPKAKSDGGEKVWGPFGFPVSQGDGEKKCPGGGRDRGARGGGGAWSF